MAIRSDASRVRRHHPRQATRAPRARQRSLRGRRGARAWAGRGGAGGRFGAAATGARGRLRTFRQATILAVAVTAFLLLLLAPDLTEGAQEPVAQDTVPVTAQEIPDTVAIIQQVPVEDLQRVEDEPAEVPPEEVPRAALEQAAETMAELWVGFLSNLPKYLVALVVLLFAWLLHRLLRPVLRSALRSFTRASAITALFGVAIWLLALGIALSVLVGDIRALVGSLGLVGLALSWALQTPIESFTGWMLNSFQGYYRVGDRVAVGEVFGDVYRIDVLTTTVWEIGSPEQEGPVGAEQPTGRLITFPNYEVLRGSIVNLTRDFPYVWDELTVPVGNRSDLPYATAVLQEVAEGVLGDQMTEPARQYESILQAARLETAVADRPQVFVSLDDSWTNLTIRYLTPARERRKWKSLLAQTVMEELGREQHKERIVSVFPRRQIQLIGPDGQAREVPGALSEPPPP
jgi:small-conductance mechanosensitive channel